MLVVAIGNRYRGYVLRGHRATGVCRLSFGATGDTHPRRRLALLNAILLLPMTCLVLFDDPLNLQMWLTVIMGADVVLQLSLARDEIVLAPAGIIIRDRMTPWQDVTWYRWYEHQRGVLIAEEGRLYSAPLTILPVAEDQVADVESLLREYLAGKRLDDVETALRETATAAA